jgi:hypothetical protein
MQKKAGLSKYERQDSGNQRSFELNPAGRSIRRLKLPILLHYRQE